MSLKKQSIFHQKRKGAVLIVSMIFVVIFSALAISMASMSGVNVQIADNQHQVNTALSATHSGLEIVRHYLSNINIAGTVSSGERLAAVATALQSNFTAAGMSNMSASYNEATSVITIPNVTLSSQLGQTFNATVSEFDADTLQVDITGSSGDFDRNVRVRFGFATVGSGVFDYGVATKGPLMMEGQADLHGVNVSIESSVYIEADGVAGDAFSITNHASVAGDVSIADPYATYSAGYHTSVGGASGDDIDDHVHIGIDYAVFPTPDPDHFRSYATGIEIDDNSDWEHDSVLSNVTIAAGTNPTFSSSVVVNGIMFIEQPNTVTFAGQATINGIIIGDGEMDADGSGSGSSISFAGQVVNNDMSTLSGSEFDGIKQETGTFVLAPGFDLDFSGQANSVNGVIAGSGISFSGQSGGTINGSIINYSEDPMHISGQSTLLFNRSGTESDPAGFMPNQVLQFQSSSYSEVTM